MTCGLGLGILLIGLVQAELVCCSRAKEVLRPQKGNTNAGFPLPNSSLRNPGHNLQDQLRQGFISPRSAQSSSFNNNPAASSAYGQRLSVRSFTQPLPQPAQTLRRQSSLFTNPNRQTYSRRVNVRLVPNESVDAPCAIGGTSVSRCRKTLKENLDRKDARSVQQGTSRRLRKSYPFRPVYQAAEQQPSDKGHATLFGPVAPGPGRSSVQMQTYAQARARRVTSSRASSLGKGFRPKTTAGKPQLSPQFALNVSGYRPGGLLQLGSLAVPGRSKVGVSVPGFAPVTVYELPEPFGGSAIRRLRRPERTLV
ncbi:uncharacterized protein LOC105933930 [Fundulus heteroclitus]|uniref:uncharacterized protein LOC105933930 n=1 Tax=Fundulus heteroclitus TaxID=8078 RepID=UPI00165A36BB|nr:uncharacterized protein LOC105933930 [Fundulus heteroclitus]